MIVTMVTWYLSFIRKRIVITTCDYDARKHDTDE